MEMSVIAEFNCLMLGNSGDCSSPRGSLECLSKSVAVQVTLANVKEEQTVEEASSRLFPLVLGRLSASRRSELDYTYHLHTLQNSANSELNRRLGERCSGLSKKYTKLLKKLKVSKTSQSCSICQQAFIKEELIVQLPCKHIFHKTGCLSDWLKVSVHCPICKLNVEQHYRNQELSDPQAQ